jgi:hypothetical protein
VKVRLSERCSSLVPPSYGSSDLRTTKGLETDQHTLTGPELLETICSERLKNQHYFDKYHRRASRRVYGLLACFLRRYSRNFAFSSEKPFDESSGCYLCIGDDGWFHNRHVADLDQIEIALVLVLGIAIGYSIRACNFRRKATKGPIVNGIVSYSTKRR